MNIVKYLSIALWSALSLLSWAPRVRKSGIASHCFIQEYHLISWCCWVLGLNNEIFIHSWSNPSSTGQAASLYLKKNVRAWGNDFEILKLDKFGSSRCLRNGFKDKRTERFYDKLCSTKKNLKQEERKKNFLTLMKKAEKIV